MKVDMKAKYSALPHRPLKSSATPAFLKALTEEKRHLKIWLLLLTSGLLLSVILAIAIGSVAIPVLRVWEIVAHPLFPDWIEKDWPGFQNGIVWNIRLPRVFLGAIVGAGLTLVGITMQTLVRNPLADPYLLGISSGASVGAVCVILFGPLILGQYALPVAAFMGALLALVAVFLIARQSGQLSPIRLILAGIATAFVFSSITNFLIFQAKDHSAARQVLFWMLGGLGNAQWEQLAVPFLALVLVTFFLMSQSKAMNALLVGPETAATLGVDVPRLRNQLFIVSALLTGVLVAVSGAIGFVGLLAPHIVKLCVGSDHKKVLPIGFLFGGIFLIWVDVLARVILSPQELPIGILTAFLGAPFFIWLMRFKGKMLQGDA